MRTFFGTVRIPFGLTPAQLIPWAVGACAFIFPDDDDVYGKGVFIGLAIIIAFLQSEYGQALENKLVPGLRAWWRRLRIPWLKRGIKDDPDDVHRYVMFAAGGWRTMRGYAPKAGTVRGKVGDHIEDLLDAFWAASKGRKLVCAMRLVWYVTRIGTGRLLWSAMHGNAKSELLFCGERTGLTWKGITCMPNLDLSKFTGPDRRLVLHHPTHAIKRSDLTAHDEFWCAHLNGGRPVIYENTVLKDRILPGVYTIRPLPERPRLIVFEDILKRNNDPTRMFWGWNMLTGEYDWWTLNQFTNMLLMGLPGGGKTVKSLQDFLSMVRHPQVTEIFVLDVAKRGAGFGRFEGLNGKVKVATNFQAACKMMNELRHGYLNWRYEKIEQKRNTNQFVNNQVVLFIDEMSVLHGHVPNPPDNLVGDERDAWIKDEKAAHKTLLDNIEAWTATGREAYCHTYLIGQKLITLNCRSSIRTNCAQWQACTPLDDTTVQGMYGPVSTLDLSPSAQLLPGEFANRRHTRVEFHLSAVTYDHAKEKGLI